MKRLILLLITFSFLSVIEIKADTIPTAQDGLWIDGSTWVGGRVPTSNDVAIIRHDVTVPADTVRCFWLGWWRYCLTRGRYVYVQSLIVEDTGRVEFEWGNLTSVIYAPRLYVYDSLAVNGSLNGQVTSAGTNSVYLSRLLMYGNKLSGTGVIQFFGMELYDTLMVYPGTDIFGYLFSIDVQTDSVRNYGKLYLTSVYGNGGTWLNMPNSFVQVTQGFDLGGGPLYANYPGNTVAYAPDALIDTLYVYGSVDSTYWNLKIGGANNVKLNFDILILGDLYIESGTFVAPHKIVLKGDWTDYGDFQGDGSRVILDSIGPQTITASAVENFEDLELKTQNGVYLKSPIEVSDTLLLATNVYANENYVLLGSSTTNIGVLDYVSGNIYGEMRRWVVESATPYFFPIARSSYITHVNITFPALGSGGLVSFVFVPEYPGVLGLPKSDDTATVYNPFAEGYWKADTAEGFDLGGNTYSISLKGEGFSSFTINDSTRIIVRPAVDSTWRFDGVKGVNDPTNSIVVRNDLDSFPWQFAFGDTTNCKAPLLTGINGPTDVCRGDNNIEYTTDTSSTWNFVWSITGGTIAQNNGDTVLVNWQDAGGIGELSVYAENGCSRGNTVSLTVNINPVIPDNLLGPTAVPENTDSLLYAIERTNGYRYSWYTSANASVDTMFPNPINDSALVSFTVPGTDTIFVILTDTLHNCLADTGIYPILVYDVITSVTSGDWDNAGTWDCSCVPLPTDNVKISSGTTVNLSPVSNGTVQLLSISVNNLFVEVGGTLTQPSTAAVAFLKVDGDLINNGDIKYTSAAYNLQLKGVDKYLGGTGRFYVDTVELLGSRIVLPGSNLKFYGGVNPPGNIKLNSNYLYNQGTLLVTGDIVADASGTLENGYNANLIIQGSLLPTGGDLIADTVGNVVDYNGGNQDVIPVSPAADGYYTLRLSGSGTKTASGNLTVLGDLIITDSASLDVSAGYDITLYGNWVDQSLAADPFIEGTQTVIFNGNGEQYIISPYIETFYNLKIGVNSTLVMPPGQYINVKGTPYIDGILRMQFNKLYDTLPSFIYDNDIVFGTSGKVETELFINGKQWHMVSVNIKGYDSELFTKSIGSVYNPNLYWYDETIDVDTNPSTEPQPFDITRLSYGWKFVQATSTSPAQPLPLNRGYLFYTDRDQKIITSGVPASVTEVFDTTLSYTENDPNTDGDTLPNLYDGWNCLGNPYTAYLSIDSLVNNATSVSNGVYVWDDANGQYAGYQNGFRVLSGRLGPFVPPLQGFMMRAEAAGASVQIRPQYRVHAHQMYLKQAQQKYLKFRQNAIKLRLIANDRQDNFVLYFYDKAKNGYDPQYDLLHIMPDLSKFPQAPNLYTVVEKYPLALCGMNTEAINSTILPLYVKVGVDGNYKIQVPYIYGLTEQFVFLYDRQTERLIRLTQGTEYTFTYKTTDDPHRFDLLIIEDNAPQIVDQIGTVYAYEDSVFTLDLSKYFVDVDKFDTLKFVVSGKDGLPAWLKVENGKLYGTPTQQDLGQYKLSVTAYDLMYKSVTQDFVIEVLNTNDPPKLTNPLTDFEVVATTPLVILLPQDMFTDPDPDDELTISIENMPTWMKFDAENNLLQGYPAIGDVGSYKITIVATDKSGAKAQQQIEIKVVKPEDWTNNIQVYPVPTSDILNIAILQDFNSAKFTVYSLDGRMLKQGRLTGTKNVVNVLDLQSGTYMLELSIDNSVYKFVITKF